MKNRKIVRFWPLIEPGLKTDNNLLQNIENRFTFNVSKIYQLSESGQ